MTDTLGDWSKGSIILLHVQRRRQSALTRHFWCTCGALQPLNTHNRKQTHTHRHTVSVQLRCWRNWFSPPLSSSAAAAAQRTVCQQLFTEQGQKITREGREEDREKEGGGDDREKKTKGNKQRDRQTDRQHVHWTHWSQHAGLTIAKPQDDFNVYGVNTVYLIILGSSATWKFLLWIVKTYEGIRKTTRGRLCIRKNNV